MNALPCRRCRHNSSKCSHRPLLTLAVGHPFNRPHLMPLVELVGGEKTNTETIARTIDFYTSLGKRPMHIRNEMKGFVANRLQAALWREIFFLRSEDVADVAAIDDAVSWGPGIRWG